MIFTDISVQKEEIFIVNNRPKTPVYIGATSVFSPYNN